MKKIIELRRKRGKLVADARALNDRVEGENRAMTQEEQNSWDAMMNEVEALRVQIEREERLLESERELGETDGDNGRRMGGDEDADPDARGGREEQGGDPRATAEYRAAFDRYVRRGLDGLVGMENRAVLQADSDSGGGFLVPTALADRLIKAIDNMVYIRQAATVLSVTNAEAMGVPTLETDPSDSVWTSELATGSEDTSTEFGRRDFRPHPLAKRIKISRKLLRLLPNIDDFIIERLAYKFAITQEKAFLTGDGAGKPLGVFVASAKGISTGRDEATDNTSTAVTADGMINAKYKLKAQYWPNARWLFHRDIVKQVAKLQTDDGHYLWRESARTGEPDMLLGRPVMMSEEAPNTSTTGQYVGMLGDWSQYWIADALTMQLQRLDELYAESNQVGLIGRMETDGMPVLEEAFVRIKLG